MTRPNATCGGNLGFGKWGDKYAWRCKINPHHHMRIRRHHLKLPKMLALIPQKQRRALEEQLGVSLGPSSQSRSGVQGELF
jgi:hypothetical protein